MTVCILKNSPILSAKYSYLLLYSFLSKKFMKYPRLEGLSFQVFSSRHFTIAFVIFSEYSPDTFRRINFEVLPLATGAE